LQNSKASDLRHAWVTSYPFLPGKYDMLLDTLPDKRRLLAKVALVHPEGDESLGLISVELQYAPEGGQPLVLDYHAFSSRFRGSEIFKVSLAFPYDSFWRLAGAGLKCTEILVVRGGWGIPTEGRYAYRFEGRLYCRTGLERLRAIGQVAFCHEAADC